MRFIENSSYEFHSDDGKELSKRKFESGLEKLVGCSLRRLKSGTKAEKYLKPFIEELIRNSSIPLSLLKFIPASPAKVGKTKFDQLYDASMAIAFPGYSKKTLSEFMGTDEYQLESTKIWRVITPVKFGISSVLIKAPSYQDAFALACDYACRMSLRVKKKIPVDLTIRVMFVTERGLTAALGHRWNVTADRRLCTLDKRIFSSVEKSIAINAALGHPKDPLRSIARYSEMRDINVIQKELGITKVTRIMLEKPLIHSEYNKKQKPAKPRSSRTFKRKLKDGTIKEGKKKNKNNQKQQTRQ